MRAGASGYHRPVMRLNKFLRDAGVGARRKVDELVEQGRVQVDGRTVYEPWHQVETEREQITVDGRLVSLSATRVYLKLYKPRGVTSTMADPYAERTLAVYNPPGVRLAPAGRLDRDSEGLVLLTNDGALIHRLSHPRFGVAKRYRVTLIRAPGREVIARLEMGFELDDGPFRPVDVRRIGQREVELSLLEGRKREIRRAFQTLGHRVERLVRLSIGPVALGSLRPGESVPFTDRELKDLGVIPER